MAGVISFPPVLKENPYQRLLYDALAPHGYKIVDGGELELRWLIKRRRELRVLHFHWPQEYYRHHRWRKGPVSWAKLALFGARLAGARLLGYRVVWTIHEVFPLKTESRELDRLGGRVLAFFSNLLLTNDRETADEAREELGRVGAGAHVVPHSSYIGAYPPGRAREEMRRELGIADDALVILLFGHVSDYKRVPWFVDAFRRAGLDDAVLVVAGLVMDESSGDAVTQAAAEDERVKALLEFIPDERVAELYDASDVALCPRQDGGTSAALILALSMGVPAVAASDPNYTELTNDEAAAWLFTPWDQDSVVAALERCARERDEMPERGGAGRRLVEGLTWEAMGEKIASLLDTSMSRGR
jgi:glycosyltransferase involved in cell wall biosynthesis